MAKEIDAKQFKALVAEVKKHPDESERHYAEVSGIPQGQILAALVKAEIEADPSLKIKATGAQVRTARDTDGLRWPRIAARAGISVAEAKRLYEENTGKSASDSYTGRGRKHDGTGGTSKSSGAGRKAAGSGRKTGTSGRRAAAAKKTGTGAPGRGAGRKTATTGRAAGRNRTRADRNVASGDPQ